MSDAVTRWVPLVEHGLWATRSLVVCFMFYRSLFVLLAIVLSVLLQFMVSDYPPWYLQTLLEGEAKTNAKRTKGQTLIHKTLHRKLKIEYHERE